ncbi:hypothetical protein [Mesorhizobium sp. L-8-10]|uniref:hypothetical protein n=1 Tax=Mesorhizobium sp. L-8-10 TaxID=2744523 RepID=UPI00192865A8|nr:hypothetical protein [Mesorhizobium sp. L-8-10]
MRRTLEEEFKTIDYVLSSGIETRGVDAFCLAWIKYERQQRKICSFLVFQASAIKPTDASSVRRALANNVGIGHTGFRSGIQRLTNLRLKDEFGDRYAPLNNALDRASKARDKIFHGQQTGQGYSRVQLVVMVENIREWCGLLAALSAAKFGYDGFAATNSMLKAGNLLLTATVDKALEKLGWEAFIKQL